MYRLSVTLRLVLATDPANDGILIKSIRTATLIFLWNKNIKQTFERGVIGGRIFNQLANLSTISGFYHFANYSSRNTELSTKIAATGQP